MVETDMREASEVLKPCPFCGDEDPGYDDAAHGHSAVYCVRCGIVGPEGRDDAAAADLWNTRALSAHPPERWEALIEGADLLDRYAAFIRTAKAEDLELHPYLPAVEEAAADLRKLSAPSQGGKR